MDNPQPIQRGVKRKYQSHSNDVRKVIVTLNQHRATPKQIQQLTHVHPNTAASIIQVQKNENRIDKKDKSGPHKPTLSNNVKKLIIDLQSADSTLRLKDIQAAIDITILPLPPSLSTIWQVLQAAGFTTKKLTIYVSNRNSLETKMKRTNGLIQLVLN